MAHMTNYPCLAISNKTFARIQTFQSKCIIFLNRYKSLLVFQVFSLYYFDMINKIICKVSNSWEISMECYVNIVAYHTYSMYVIVTVVLKGYFCYLVEFLK